MTALLQNNCVGRIGLEKTVCVYMHSFTAYHFPISIHSVKLPHPTSHLLNMCFCLVTQGAPVIASLHLGSIHGVNECYSSLCKKLKLHPHIDLGNMEFASDTFGCLLLV